MMSERGRKEEEKENNHPKNPPRFSKRTPKRTAKFEEYLKTRIEEQQVLAGGEEKKAKQEGAREQQDKKRKMETEETEVGETSHRLKTCVVAEEGVGLRAPPEKKEEDEIENKLAELAKELLAGTNTMKQFGQLENPKLKAEPAEVNKEKKLGTTKKVRVIFSLK